MMKIWHELELDVEYEIEEGAPGKPNYVSVTGAYVCGTAIVLDDADTAAIESQITDKLQAEQNPYARTFWKAPISRGNV